MKIPGLLPLRISQDPDVTINQLAAVADTIQLSANQVVDCRKGDIAALQTALTAFRAKFTELHSVTAGATLAALRHQLENCRSKARKDQLSNRYRKQKWEAALVAGGFGAQAAKRKCFFANASDRKHVYKCSWLRCGVVFQAIASLKLYHVPRTWHTLCATHTR